MHDDKPADMKTARRMVIAVACYVLSAYGLFWSFVLAATSGKSLLGTLVGLCMLLAWGLHFAMCARWVANRPLPKWVPVYGTLFGGLSLLCWPVTDPDGAFELSDILGTVGLGLIATLPCFLLAVYLVWFHLGAPRRRNQACVS